MGHFEECRDMGFHNLGLPRAIVDVSTGHRCGITSVNVALVTEYRVCDAVEIKNTPIAFDKCNETTGLHNWDILKMIQ